MEGFLLFFRVSERHQLMFFKTQNTFVLIKRKKELIKQIPLET